jgi:NADH-quinone oxidoreductase subunit L
MRNWIWLIPLLPFVGAFLNGVVFRNRVSKTGATWIACGSVGAALVVALGVIGEFLASGQEAFEKIVYLWIPAGLLEIGGTGHGADAVAKLIDLQIPMGFLLDPLSSVMLFVVTFVGFWIHVYSVGYMSHEEGYQRYRGLGGGGPVLVPFDRFLLRPGVSSVRGAEGVHRQPHR